MSGKTDDAQRLYGPDPATMSPEQAAIHRAIIEGPRGVVEGPLAVWLHSPELAGRAQELGAFCRFHCALSPRLRELAILVTAAYWRAGFEWAVHAPLALKAGVPAEAVERIRRGEAPALADADDRVVHQVAREVLDARRVSDATYAQAVERLGAGPLVDLIGLLGYYGLISMTIVTFEVEPPPGVADPFADL